MSESFGGYEIERRLGAGGMAEVFLAQRRGPEGFAKRVALKRVLPAYNHDAEFVRLFQDEARLAARLDHPHIAGIHDFGELGGSWYMAMEYVEGADLRTVLASLGRARQPMPSDLVLLLAADLASALLYAHELEIDGAPARIVHRDVTPSNVLLSIDGAVRLADFGIAKATTHGHHTRTGVVKGKVPYMPPEQALGQAMDHRVDLFALGVLLYECLAGKRPYDGVTELDTLQRIHKGQHARLVDAAPHAVPALAAVIERLIRPEPCDRFASAGDVLDALAATPPPTNARRLLGKLVRQVQAEAAAEAASVGGRALAASASPVEQTRTAGELERGARRDESTAIARPRAVETALPIAAERPRAEEGARRGPRWVVGALAGAVALGVVAASAMAVLIATSRSAPAMQATSLEAPKAAPVGAPARVEAPAGAGSSDAGASHAEAVVERAITGDSAALAVVPAEETARAEESAPHEDEGGRDESAPRGTRARGERGAREERRADAASSSATSAPGRVHVVALPVGEVTIDGRSFGFAPVSASLRPGRHEIVVQNGAHEERRTIELGSAATERVVIRFPLDG